MRRNRGPKMPEMFNELADYNAEVARGIVHTEEWKNRMAHLQDLFNQWSSDAYGQSHRPDPLPSRLLPGASTHP